MAEFSGPPVVHASRGTKTSDHTHLDQLGEDGHHVSSRKLRASSFGVRLRSTWSSLCVGLHDDDRGQECQRRWFDHVHAQRRCETKKQRSETDTELYTL